MPEVSDPNPAPKTDGTDRTAGAWLVESLGSLKLALVVGVLIVVACILGTVLPQTQDLPAVVEALSGVKLENLIQNLPGLKAEEKAEKKSKE